jgi:hypothetical protein
MNARTAASILLMSISACACGREEVWNPTQPSSEVTLATMTLDRPTIAGGGVVGGTATLTAPAPPGGATIRVQGTGDLEVQPTSVTVPGGGTSTSFSVLTRPVDAPAQASVTASAGGVSKTASFEVRVGSFFRTNGGGLASLSEPRSFVLDNSEWEAYATFQLNTVRIRVRGNPTATSFLGEIWSLDLSAPTNRRLVAGAYPNAARFNTSTQPGLDLGAAGFGCSSDGQFTVLEADYGGQGPFFDTSGLNRFRATFEVKCSSTSAPIRGEVRVLMNPWR